MAKPKEDAASRDAPKPIGHVLDAAMASMKRRRDGTETPIATPWKTLNGKLNGGLWPGLYFLVGGTKSGKTQAALQIALDAARDGTPTLYVGLELGQVDITARLFGLQEDRAWRDFAYGEADLKEDTRYKIGSLPLHVQFAPANGWDVTDLPDLVDDLKAKHPDRPPLVIIDYLQLVAATENERRIIDLRQRIGTAAYAMRNAVNRGATVLAVSSVARTFYKRFAGKEDPAFGTGDASEFAGAGKESGEIEYAADAVLVIGGERDKQFMGIAAGRASLPGWVPMSFDGLKWSERNRAYATQAASVASNNEDDGEGY